MYVSCVCQPVSLSCFLTILRNASIFNDTYDSSMFIPRYDSETARRRRRADRAVFATRSRSAARESSDVLTRAEVSPLDKNRSSAVSRRSSRASPARRSSTLEQPRGEGV